MYPLGKRHEMERRKICRKLERCRCYKSIHTHTHTHCSSDRHLDGYLVTSSQWDTSKHPSSLFSIHSTSSVLHHLSPTTCLFVLLPLTQIFYLPLSLHPSIVMLSLSLSLAISYSVFQRWHFKGSVSETDDVSHCTFIAYEIAKLKCSSTLSLPFFKVCNESSIWGTDVIWSIFSFIICPNILQTTQCIYVSVQGHDLLNTHGLDKLGMQWITRHSLVFKVTFFMCFKTR